MKCKCIIVDDEPLAAEVIQTHLAKFDSFEIVATCQNAIEAFEVLKSKKVDLMFLDIQMPGMKGTDFLKSLSHPPKVILTTAYREYALEGYELDVIDYLLKPISFERFFKAINKFLLINSEDISFHQETGTPDANTYLYIRSNKKVHKILTKDIIYIESIKDYITIHTETKSVTTKHTISAFEEKVSDKDFLRIHRSFIVSIHHITGFTASSIEIGSRELPIGRNYKTEVFRTLNYSNTL